MHAHSYYAASLNNSFEGLSEFSQNHYDMVIIGGGFTGVSCALELALKGYQVAVIEEKVVGWGASGRNGGQLISGYNKDLDDLCARFGKSTAHQLWQMSLDAVDLVKQRVQKYQINCALKEGYCFVGQKKRHEKELQNFAKQLQSLNYPCSYLDKKKISEKIGSPVYTCGLTDPISGHLHPLNYIIGLANIAKQKGVDFYQKTTALQIQNYGKKKRILTNQGNLECNKVVIAGNAYLKNIGSKVQTRIMPVGTYIIATEPLKSNFAKSLIYDNWAVADINWVLNYFRLSEDNRMLFGGGVNYSGTQHVNIKKMMQKKMASIFPQLDKVGIDYAWGGHVAITINRLPDFGKTDDNTYYAQGYSGHGIALANFAGLVIAEAIDGDARKLDIFTQIKHHKFFGGKFLRTPALVLATTYYRIKDKL